MKNNLPVIIMASGRSSRFGEDKLLYYLSGKPVICHVFDAVKSAGFENVIAVVRTEKAARIAVTYGFQLVMNDDEFFFTSETVRKGMEKVETGAKGVMLIVADQPYISPETLNGMAEAFYSKPRTILRAAFDGRAGNPVIFPEKYFEELKNLTENENGRTVIKRHQEDIILYEVGSKAELYDIDTKEDLKGDIQ